MTFSALVQARVAALGASRLSRLVVLPLVVLSFLSLVLPSIRKALELRVSLSNIQALVTTTFVDDAILSAVPNVVFLAATLPIVESALGTRELGRVLVVAGIGSNIVSLFVVAMLLGLLGDALPAGTTGDAVEEAAALRISGASALTGAVLVCLKQHEPGRALWHGAPAQSMWARATWNEAPFFAIFLSWVLRAVLGTSSKGPLLLSVGVYLAWLTLRFFSVDQDTGAVGDLRDSFSFASLFPNIGPLRPAIRALSLVVYRFCVTMGCFHSARDSQLQQRRRRQQSSVDEATRGILSSSDPAAGTTRATYADPEAEERRAAAIQAIDAKLAALASRAAAPMRADDVVLAVDSDAKSPQALNTSAPPFPNLSPHV